MKLFKLSNELEYKKVLAIDNEDYDAAKIIKQELDKVKKQLMVDNSLPRVRGSSMSSRSIHTPLSDAPSNNGDKTDANRQLIHSLSQIQTDLHRVNYNVSKPDPLKSYNHNFQTYRTTDGPVVAEPTFQNMPEYAENMPPRSAMGSQYHHDGAPMHPSMHGMGGMGTTMQSELGRDPGYIMQDEPTHEDAVVPMHNKGPIDFTKVKDDNQDQIGGEIEEEEFSGPDKARLDLMKQYFSEDTSKQILSKKWQNRKKGLESFIKEFPGSLKEHGIAVQEHAVTIFLENCKEKLPQMVETNIELFQAILEESKK